MTTDLLKRLEAEKEPTRCKFPLCSSHWPGGCVMCPESKYDDPAALLKAKRAGSGTEKEG